MIDKQATRLALFFSPLLSTTILPTILPMESSGCGSPTATLSVKLPSRMDMDKKPADRFAEDHEVDYGSPEDNQDRRDHAGGEAQDEHVLNLNERMQHLTIECAVAKDREENMRRELRGSRAKVRQATDMSLKMADAVGRMHQELEQKKDEVWRLEVLNDKMRDVVCNRDSEVYELQEQLARLTVEDSECREGGCKRQRMSEYSSESGTRQLSVNTRASGTTNSSAAADEYARRAYPPGWAVDQRTKRREATGCAELFGGESDPGHTSLAAAAGKPISFRPEPKHTKAMYAYVIPPQVQLHPVNERGFPVTAAGFHWHNQLQQQQKVVVIAHNLFYLYAYSRAVPEHERTAVQQLACTDYRMPDWFAYMLRAAYETDKGQRTRDRFPTLKRTEVGWNPVLVAEIFQHKEFLECGCVFVDPYWTIDDRLVEAWLLVQLKGVARTHGKNAPPPTQAETSDQLIVEAQIMGVLGTPGLYASRVTELDLKIAPWMELVPWPTPLTAPCGPDDVCIRFAKMGVPIARVRDALAYARAWFGVAPVPQSANSQIALLIANGKARPVEDNDAIRWNNPFVPCADKAAKRVNAVAKHQMQTRQPSTIPYTVSRGRNTHAPGRFSSQSVAAPRVSHVSPTTTHNEEDVSMPPPSSDRSLASSAYAPLNTDTTMDEVATNAPLLRARSLSPDAHYIPSPHHARARSLSPEMDVP
ncbi:hypothetical protein B0H16DRAFT_1472781 [Mycena metata]|uniref:Uncharacterized protein n=1 Tax=Mycena metata TaxID=1033252 RepID=A0AAD7MML5_9AGAR|nr:hypothetical protein B0H16DRAFT_1472781 [Mycena metata]